MAKEYDFTAIEKKWQNYWEGNHTFRAVDFSSKPKYYVLDMFPYPSGAGLHVGHPEGYTATDITCRYKRMRGFNVLHPMGWDAFGLPAEQYAVETGTHPSITTEKNVDNFRRQIKSLGFSYDWEREINTTDVNYYKWTQWIFMQLHKRGLAYLDEVAVNWCPALGTVLANEEVIDGRSERGNHPVIRKPMKQWMLKITEYAERLLQDLDELDWSEGIKEMQRNWIGKSIGAEVTFKTTAGSSVTVYTTRPDTLFGATYMVLAPEHPLVKELTTPENAAAVKAYQEAAAAKSELDRTSDNSKEKTGCFTGSYAIDPVNGREIPVWIADYVLISYGTGAIMAVPAHDTRDFDFAKAFGLPVICIIEPDAEQAKARKRMLGLSVFFIVLLSVVVVTFVLILTTVLNRNQSLSDRLLDYALKDSAKASTVVHTAAPVMQQQPSADVVKALLERFEKEQAEMKDAFVRQQKEAEEKAEAARRQHAAEMKSIQQQLAAEQAKMKKKADKEAEIERHRRRLYPDYYRMEKDGELPIPPPASSYRKQRAEIEAEASREQVSVKPQQPKASTPPPEPKKASSPLSALKPVTYFNVDDDDSVPFLIETPKQNK